MAIDITIVDETSSGQRSNASNLRVSRGRMTLRELIRRRVHAEVEAYNAKLPEYFRGLVQPNEAERTLNGYRMKKPRPVSAEAQCEKAFASFAANGFFVLLGDKQLESLDTEIEVTHPCELHFVKLVPLVGG
jgi:hypothetical protein